MSMQQVLQGLLYSIIVSSVFQDGNPGALRALKEAEQWKENIEYQK